MVKVDLTASPYHLNNNQIAWVEETLGKLTDEEKIGQLFFNLFSLEGGKKFFDADLTNKDILERYHIGGARYEGGNKEEVQNLLNDLQRHTKVPVLVAANCDSGGNGHVKMVRISQVLLNVKLPKIQKFHIMLVSFQHVNPQHLVYTLISIPV